MTTSPKIVFYRCAFVSAVFNCPCLAPFLSLLCLQYPLCTASVSENSVFQLLKTFKCTINDFLWNGLGINRQSEQNVFSNLYRRLSWGECWENPLCTLSPDIPSVIRDLNYNYNQLQHRSKLLKPLLQSTTTLMLTSRVGICGSFLFFGSSLFVFHR